MKVNTLSKSGIDRSIFISFISIPDFDSTSIVTEPNLVLMKVEQS